MEPRVDHFLYFLLFFHFCIYCTLSQADKQALLEAAALPSVFTLGRKPFALGKGFAECSIRQSPLCKNFLGKGSLPSAFYRGTWQNKKQFCQVLGRHSAKYFRPLWHRPLTVILPSARPSTRQKKIIFLKNYFAECPNPGTRQSFFYFFLKYFAECPCPDTRQSFFYFFLKITLPSAPVLVLGKEFLI